MVNQKLVDWIINEGSQGYSSQELYEALVKQGYNPDEVKDAIMLATSSKTSTDKELKSSQKHKRIISILIVLVLAIGLLLYGGFLLLKESKEQERIETANEELKQKGIECENSGGEWRCMNCCPYMEIPQCHCDCSITTIASFNLSDPFKYKARDSEKNHICTTCETDDDCGDSTCKIDERNGCNEVLIQCINGICQRDENYYRGGENVYHCNNLKCELLESKD